MRRVYLKILIAAASLPITLWALLRAWLLSDFFYQKHLHELLIVLGKAEDPTIGQQLWLNLTWAPFLLLLCLVIGIYSAVVWSLARSRRDGR